MNPKQFFAELRRRSVYKVAVAYAVIAWLLIQGASIFFPTFEAPSWVTKVFIAIVVLGFPAALVLAWAFDLTPEGIKRTKVGDADVALTSVIAEKSIALLPFENLSADPENAFFVDGVHDEILTDLSRIADLKVISRTSVMQYKTGAKRNLREIANELGVAHIVEGSVQRAGNRV
jgi:hypothetical protein